MEKVLGIGGLFFRARDPARLSVWHQDKLGVTTVVTDYDHSPWQQQGGSTAFAPFAQDTDYFGDPALPRCYSKVTHGRVRKSGWHLFYVCAGAAST